MRLCFLDLGEPSSRPATDGRLLSSPLDLSLTPSLIVKTIETCGNSARVVGTRIPVWLLVAYRQGGAADEQIIQDYPHLTQNDLDAAWSYAEGHPLEIQDEIAEQDRLA